MPQMNAKVHRPLQHPMVSLPSAEPRGGESRRKTLKMFRWVVEIHHHHHHHLRYHHPLEGRLAGWQPRYRRSLLGFTEQSAALQELWEIKG